MFRYDSSHHTAVAMIDVADIKEAVRGLCLADAAITSQFCSIVLRIPAARRCAQDGTGVPLNYIRDNHCCPSYEHDRRCCINITVGLFQDAR